MSKPPAKHDPNDGSQQDMSPATLLVTSGRDSEAQMGFVNPPIVRGSTVLYPNAADFHAHRAPFQYGRHGTPTTQALELALMALEGPDCAGVKLAPSGLAAISTALLSVLNAGDHLLVSDSVYRPTRHVCDDVLARLGIKTTYFDPLIGAGIDSLFQANTRAVFVEAPGSQTFEMNDIPAIAAIAHARGALVLNDNTWATPLYFRSFEKGVDISIQSGTKYLGGHSDIMFGTIAANAKSWPKIVAGVRALGICAGPDDVFLALRGLRTLGVRLAHHQASGIAMAEWLKARVEVARVLHPALPDDPGHAIWQRDFSGASGLFSVILKPVSKRALDAFLDSLTLFGMGFSWGGFESLVIAFDASTYRTATRWQAEGPALRFHIGLEALSDLQADLDRALDAMRAADE